ncbi:MAG: response regulator [Kiloniellales bacterium]|nr:response regulator [Kiloniellales bacterium]
MAKSRRILVVVDDRDVAEGLYEVLEMAGHEVALALRADEARELLAKRCFDFALINLRLPGMGTVESFLEIQRLRPEMEAILMTGSTVEQLMAEVVVDGQASTLHLPLDYPYLDKALERAEPQGVVLLPSDSEDFAQQLCEYMGKHGREALVARSEQEALDLIEGVFEHHVVLDLGLSVVSAMSVYLKMRDRGYAKPLTIVGRSPLPGAETTAPYRDLWITGILFKPFDPRKLLLALEQESGVLEFVPAEEPEEAAPTGAPQVFRVPTASEVAPPPEPPSYAGEGRVLIVEDDPEMAEGIRELLEPRGYETQTAQAFEEALRKLRSFEPNVVLIDVQIGARNGLDLVPELRQHWPEVIPIMLTALADKDTIVAALRGGAYDYVTKPFEAEELFAALDRSFKRIAAGITTDEEWLSKISYGLRTPLNAVVGFSEILKDELLGPLGSEQYVAYAKDINAAGQQITGMLGSISERTNAAADGDEAPEDEAETAEIPFDLEILPESSEAAAEDDRETECEGEGEAEVCPSVAAQSGKRFQIPNLQALRKKPRPEDAGPDNPEI